MSYLSRIKSVLRRLRNPHKAEADLDAEVQSYFDTIVERRISQGMTRAAALRATRLEYDNADRVKEKVRDARAGAWFETLFQDLRYAARSLRKQPGFTAVATLTLAVGIGANTAIYTVIDATMWRSLPFREPDRLMRVSLTRPPGPNDRSDPQDVVWSYPKYELFRKLQQSFEETALYRPMTLNLTSPGEPQVLEGELVSASYFPLLGVRPELGRAFLPSEDEVPGRDYVAMISHSLWANRFGADASIAGKTIVMSQRTYTIVGVLPPDFRALGGPADVWVPLHTDNSGQLTQAGLHSYQQVARLNPHIPVEQAKAAVSALGPRMEAALPGSWMKGGGIGARTFNEARIDPLIRESVLILFGAVTFVLLIACANLANLLLARGTTRTREIAIRFAVGATKSRIVRYLLTESLLLAGIGAAVGLLLADAGVFALDAINPINGNALTVGRRLSGLTIMGLNSIHLDGRAVCFTLAIALLTGILFGLAPAFAGARTDVNDALKNSSVRPRGIGIVTGRSLLVVSEVALTMVLLAGAGLTLKSFARLIATRSGVDPENVLTVRINSTSPRTGQFFSELEQRVAVLPGVISATLIDRPPLAGQFSSTVVVLKDRPAPPSNDDSNIIGVHWVSPSYLASMKIPLLSGRWFSSADRNDTPSVTVINETAARRYWPGEDPIGKRVGLGFSTASRDFFRDGAEVIGVVGDVRYGKPDELPPPDAYVSTAQMAPSSLMLLVRTKSNPLTLTDSLRRTVHELDKDQPLYDIRTLDQRFADSSAQARFITILLTAFAAIAFALAGIGIYGVMSYMVRQRTREIGIRMALGARREDVRRMVVLRAGALALAGMAVGLGGAFWLTNVLRASLYQVNATDPETYLAISALVIILAALSSYLPASRASRIDPCLSLRSE